MKLNKRTFLPAKSLRYAIVWLLSIMIVSIFTCLVYFLNSLDELAAVELEQRVQLARKLEFRNARDLLEEYTFWDDAYEKIIVDLDTNWVKGNSGDYLMNKRDYDFSVAVAPGNKEVYLIKSDDVPNLSFSDLKQPLFELMDASRQLNTQTRLTNGFFRINGSVYHIVGGPFINEQSELPREGTYLALGKRIDSEYRKILENEYQLFGLHLKAQPIDLKAYMPLYTPTGNTVGYITWKPHSPSKTIIPTITFIAILFAFLITVVTSYILKKEQMSWEEYENQLFIEATTDSLTKVKNRRYFMVMGETELNTCRLIENKQLSVLILDIDYFKQINDEFGHAVGDKALIHFSQLCKTALRSRDTLGRIGGEEFAVILPLTNEKRATEIANRIRVLIERSPFVSNGKIISLTVSIGISSYRNQENLEKLLEEADQALYDAKHHSRNCVMSYKSLTTEPSLIQT